MNMINKRAFLLLILVALLLFVLIVPLVFLLRHSIPNNFTDLWTLPANQANFIIGFVASLACTVLIGLSTQLWKRISRLVKPVVLRQRSLESEKLNIEQERLYLENLIAGLTSELDWDVEKYTDLEAIQNDAVQTAYLIRPRFWGQSESQQDLIDDGSRGPRINVPRFLRSEKGPIMLKGEPSTGKTLTVRRFAVD